MLRVFVYAGNIMTESNGRSTNRQPGTSVFMGHSCFVPAAIQTAVLAALTRAYGVSAEQILGPARDRRLTSVRQVGMFMYRSIWGWRDWTELAPLDWATAQQIGLALNRDHTTVLYGCDAVIVQYQASDYAREALVAAFDRLIEELPTERDKQRAGLVRAHIAAGRALSTIYRQSPKASQAE